MQGMGSSGLFSAYRAFQCSTQCHLRPMPSLTVALSARHYLIPPSLRKAACLWLRSTLFYTYHYAFLHLLSFMKVRAGPSLSMPKTLSTVTRMQPAIQGSWSHWKPTPTIPDVLISISTGNEGWLCFSHCQYFHTKTRVSRFYYKSLKTWVLKHTLCASLNGSPNSLQNHRL